MVNSSYVKQKELIMATQKRYTKKRFEQWLNATFGCNLGSRMRKNDPIAFDIEFNCRRRLVEKHGARA